MVKKIPSKVVRTESLGKSSNALHHVSSSKNFRHKIDYFNPRRKSVNDTFIYTKMLEITSISKDNYLGGEVLDCYV